MNVKRSERKAKEDFLRAVSEEYDRAVNLHLKENNFLALSEEVGEVAKAILEQDSEGVRCECVQVATMAMRIFLRGAGIR